MSSTRMFGPLSSGPNAQIDRAARRSQSYFDWKNSPSLLRSHSELTYFGRLLLLGVSTASARGSSLHRLHQSCVVLSVSLSRVAIGIGMHTLPSSMSSARPFSSGSAIIVSLFFLFGVSAKHFRLDVSTTCSAQPSRAKGADSRVKGTDTRVKGTGNRVKGTDTRVKGTGSRVKGTDNTVRGCCRVPFRRTT